jgi:putative membrane protein
MPKTTTPPEPHGVFHTLLTGIAMGAADVVPGVSGGTVALLCGVYSRLLRAITRFDLTLIGYVRQRQWQKIASHLDLGFLIPLLAGLGLGLGTSILTIKRLLESDSARPVTLAWFCGMILASVWILLKAIKPKSATEKVFVPLAMIAGIMVAAWLSTLPPASTDSQPAAWFVFSCGMIGICAMILPGISGAMILLLLGTYGYLLSLPDKVLAGQWQEPLTTVVLFGLGCATGLAVFSRILTWLLNRFAVGTLSLLSGLMIGSIVRLWPFQTVTEVAHVESITWNWPTGDMTSWASFAALLVGVGLILAIQKIAARMARSRQAS